MTDREQQTAKFRPFLTGDILPGKAFDIAISGFNGLGSKEHLWILDWNGDPANGHSVRVWTGKQFDLAGERGYRVAVDRDGIPWVRTKNSRAAVFQNAKWTEVDGDVWDIGIGGQVMWASKTRKKSENGPMVYRAGSAWTEAGCRGFEVSVSKTGEPWFTTTGQSGYQIWRLRNGVCEHLPGAAVDVAVYDDQNAWVIGRDNFLYNWSEVSHSWTRVDVTLGVQTQSSLCHRVAVSSGLPVVTTINGEVFRATRYWQSVGP